MHQLVLLLLNWRVLGLAALCFGQIGAGYIDIVDSVVEFVNVLSVLVEYLLGLSVVTIGVLQALVQRDLDVSIYLGVRVVGSVDRVEDRRVVGPSRVHHVAFRW